MQILVQKAACVVVTLVTWPPTAAAAGKSLANTYQMLMISFLYYHVNPFFSVCFLQRNLAGQINGVSSLNT